MRLVILTVIDLRKCDSSFILICIVYISFNTDLYCIYFF